MTEILYEKSSKAVTDQRMPTGMFSAGKTTVYAECDNCGHQRPITHTPYSVAGLEQVTHEHIKWYETVPQTTTEWVDFYRDVQDELSKR